VWKAVCVIRHWPAGPVWFQRALNLDRSSAAAVAVVRSSTVVAVPVSHPGPLCHCHTRMTATALARPSFSSLAGAPETLLRFK